MRPALSLILLLCLAAAPADQTVDALAVPPLKLVNGRITMTGPCDRIAVEGLRHYFNWEGGSTRIIFERDGATRISFKLDVIGPGYLWVSLCDTGDYVVISAWGQDIDINPECRVFDSWSDVISHRYDSVVQVLFACLRRINRNSRFQFIER